MDRRECPVCKVQRPKVCFVPGRHQGMCQICFEDTYSLRAKRPKTGVFDNYVEITSRDRAASLLAGAAARAKKSNKGFDLTFEWLLPKLIARVCEVTGLPLAALTSDGIENPFTPSIDKKDPSGGYTQDNCQVVMWAYNAAKGQGSAADVEVMARAICGLLTDEDRQHAAAKTRDNPYLAELIKKKEDEDYVRHAKYREQISS